MSFRIDDDAVCSDLESMRQLQDRPLNVLDLFLLEKYDGIPKSVEDYVGAIRHPTIAEEFIKYLMGLSGNDAQRIGDLLIQDSVLYAIDKSKLYQNKYMNHLKITDLDRLRDWITNNIKTSEDMDLLPSFKNEDIRRPELDHNAWWIAGKRIAGTYQTGGSTGKPSIIPFSPIDKILGSLVNAALVRKYLNINDGDKLLILAPAEPHPLGPLLAYSFEIMGIPTIPYWKHFKNPSPEEILSMISEIKPDIIVSAPHGPKGANAAFDVLLATDQRNGTDILPNCLEGKAIFSGGAPMARNLVEEFYDMVGVKSIICGYGSAQFCGSVGKIDRNHDENDPDFSSNVEIPEYFWSVSPIPDPESPDSWSRFGITVLGREAMPIIKFDPGDYGQVNLSEKQLNNICRVEWFYKDAATGRYCVKIPSQVYTCISGV